MHMKIAVFGATGKTGIQAVEQALKADYQVTAFVRNPDNFSISHTNLSVIKADVLVPSTFDTKLAGHDAVLSALGTGRRYDETTLYSEGGKNIIEAMRKAGVKRFICLTSGGVVDDLPPGNDSASTPKPIFNNVQLDMKRMEDYLKSFRDIEWCIIRPPELTNTEFTGKYEISHIYIPKIGRKISRADLADFMLKQITENTYLYKTPTIHYKSETFK